MKSSFNPTLEKAKLLGNLRSAIWILGISCWIFGIGDRSVAALADGYVSAWELIQLCTATFFFVSWIFLKPTNRL